MNKNRKLLALICAISMIFSVFAGLTVARAEGEPTLSFANIAEVDGSEGKTITMDIVYANAPDGIAGANIYVELPENVIGVESNSVLGAAPTTNFADSKFSFIWSQSTNKADFANNTITSLTLTLNNALKSDTGISFGADTNIAIVNESGIPKTSSLQNGKLVATNGTLPAYVDPNAKPVTTATPVPVATEPPADESKPAPIPEVTVDENGGIDFTYVSTSENGKEVTLDISYVGYTDGIAGANLYVDFPSNVTNVEGTSVLGAAPTTNFAEGKYSFIWSQSTNKNDFPDNKIVSLKLTLDEPFADLTRIPLGADTNVAIVNESGIPKTSSIQNGKLRAVTATIPAYTGDEPEPQDVVDTVDLSDAITKTVTDTPDGTSKESEYFIIPKVTVVDPETKEVVDAEYGEQGDYVAVIGDTVLTPAQYSNLINGYLGADNVKDIVAANNINNINDVISKIGLRVYNSTAKISAQLVNKTTKEIENADDGEIEVEPSNPDNPNYKKPTLSVKASKTSTTVGSGDTITVTATYDFKDYADNATVAISAVDDTLDLATSSGFKIEYEQAEEDLLDLVTKIEDDVTLIDNIAEKGTIKITYKPGSVGTAKFTFAITGQNEAGTVLDPAVTGSASTKINKASTSGSGSGSSSKDKDNTSSGGGAIATGLVDSGSGYIPSLGFDDLGDVEWAQNAINTLAAKKIVSGVGDNKFDPNAALTRAAYAQMLVNAIGHSQDSADVEFDDVPTDAWFYHNVAVAAQLGIVAGFGDGTFRPYDLITREQMALMTQKAAVVMGKSLIGADNGTFTDDADIADWAYDAVYTLSNAGIINGMGDGSFAPQANATRAQAAVIIYQAFVK